MQQKIKDILRASIAVKQQALEVNVEPTVRAAQAIIDSYKKGGKVLLCGNGGSAADCQHVAAELVGRFQKERRALPAIALTTDTSTITALANDYSYDLIFARQLEALGQKGDILIGISTSGKSPNVLKAFEKAKALGIKTIAFAGHDGGSMAHVADISVIVPSKVTARIQETHITLFHALCELVEDAFVDKP